MKHLRLTLLPLCLLFLCAASPSDAELWYEDLTLELRSMRIDFVDLDGQEMRPRFDRDQFVISAGHGRTTFGLIYQDTSKGAATDPGVPDEGLMAHFGFEHLIGYRFRVDVSARVGLLGTNEFQPLYAEDSDVRANFIWFDADGAGFLGDQPLFPSAYVGAVVNRFGRTQAVGGVGVWWKGIGVYATAFHAFNGDDPQFDGTGFGRVNFANLKNEGYSASVSYDWRAFEFRLKQNFALENGSDDLSFAVTFRHNAYRSLD